MIAYYLTVCNLEAGSRSAPGNWGRCLNLYSMQFLNINCLPLLLRETIYEDVRKEAFPHLPSRMTSLFCCLTLEGAKLFRQTAGRHLDIIYEVEIEDKDMFMAVMEYADLPENSLDPILSAYRERAHLYWSTSYTEKNPEEIEIITPYAATVLRRVEF